MRHQLRQIVDRARADCDWNCFDVCHLNSTPHEFPILNAGEPDAALTTNLSPALVTAAGWHSDLLDYDPWQVGAKFGGAGSVQSDLTDTVFVPPVP